MVINFPGGSGSKAQIDAFCSAVRTTVPMIAEVAWHSQRSLSITRGWSSILEVIWACFHKGFLVGLAPVEVIVLGLL